MNKELTYEEEMVIDTSVKDVIDSITNLSKVLESEHAERLAGDSVRLQIVSERLQILIVKLKNIELQIEDAAEQAVYNSQFDNYPIGYTGDK
jgi:hypothetical protein